MPNHLTNENSPYLLQHAENPVDWYPWGPEALEKARNEDMPIFLSIGYAACHWCHVMAHESFENPEIAAIMNENFVNIKVDREERPDLDSIYMEAVVTMTGQGGWPMSVFLTPEGQPFYGGTYFPPVRRYNMPGFQEVLLAIARAWKQERSQLLKSGEQIVDHLKNAQPTGKQPAKQEIQPEILDQAAMTLAQNYDRKFGGWGQAPKFPQPMAIEFLQRRATRGDRLSLDLAIHTLKAMAKGGMYDVVGGGFARYSTDNNWLVPHFEKMLYDNAQLSQVYLYAFLLTGDPSYRHICEATLDFVSRELTDPEGGFYSSLDADSEGEEGKYYVWALEEIRQAVSSPDDQAFFLAAYPVTEAGNFEGKNILQRAQTDEQLAVQFHIPVEEAPARLNQLAKRLLIEREKRIRPGLDDKVLVSWNALMLSSFAEAARYLHRPDYAKIAEKNANFLLANMHPGDRLQRSWRKGQARHSAYLEDYAALILGLLALYQTDPNPRWYDSAVQLLDEMLEHFQDPSGGFFDTRDDAESLFARPKELQDNAIPSGNAQAAMALLQLAAYSGRGDWRDRAEAMLGSIQPLAVRYPTAFARWLSALDFAIGPVHEVAILGLPGDFNTQALVEALWSDYRPRVVAAISANPPPLQAAPLLQNRPLLNDQLTAYVCQQFVCQRPVNSPAALLEQLSSP